MTSYNSIS